MPRTSRPAIPAQLLTLLVAAACGGAAPHPAPSDVRPTPTAGPRDATPSVLPTAMPPAPAGTARKHTAADARFMQGMIGHHAQALEMTALVPSRTDRREIRLIAERIEVSQRDEIALMETWLRERGEPVPASDEHAHHDMPQGEQHGGAALGDAHGDAPAMPGMLAPAELARLAAARGPAFDRLFLESMIRHHEGALTMVAQLLATQGAAQEPDTYGFVSDVDADQRAEIRRMRSVLESTSGAR